MKQMLKFSVLFLLSVSIQIFSQTKSQCLSCHSNTSLQKTIEVSGGTETIPLYVNETLYNSNKHGTLECVQCHTDITSANLYTHASGGANSLSKKYGSWARFSKSDTTLNTDGSPRTRNYYTAASLACSNTSCHTSKNNFQSSRHHTIWRLKHSKTQTVNGEVVGENYDKTCSRCHTTCATCHFKTTKIQKLEGDLLSIWSGIQSQGETAYPNASAMSEWSMDWTANIESHEFTTSDQMKQDNNVCRSCHIGFYRPATKGYLSEEAPYPTANGTSIKRHPQYYELLQSSAHKALACATCHTDVHNYPDGDFDWQTLGDAKCQNCHTMTNHYSQHTTVDCISCHATGFAKSVGQDGHDVWRWPVNGRVRPLAVKYKEALSWYPHNIEKPDPVTSCAAKCHYEGNLISAPVTGINDNEQIPLTFSLEQNYPNPFNPNTQIKYSVSKRAEVSLIIYDAIGNKVQTLFSGELQKGNYNAEFEGKNLPSGIYFARLKMNESSRTIKMLLLK